MMTMLVSKQSMKFLTMSVLASLLVACGGGGDGKRSEQPSVQPKVERPVVDEPVVVKPVISPATKKESIKKESVDKKDKTPTSNKPVHQKNPTTEHKPLETKPSKPVKKETPKKETVKKKPSSKPIKTTTVANNFASSEVVAFNELNVRRTTCGFHALDSNQALKNAAINHANYLTHMYRYSDNGFQGHHEFRVDNFSGIKNPYYSGYELKQRLNTGTKIGNKALKVNYSKNGGFGENLSTVVYSGRSYDNDELAKNMTISLLAAPYHMAGLLSPVFTEMGVAYRHAILKNPYVYADGRTQNWEGSILEIVSGVPSANDIPSWKGVLNYPCNGVGATEYKLTNESPNPLPERDLQENPIGQPIYIVGDNEIHVSNYNMVDSAGNFINLLILNSKNDPHKKLSEKEVILIPDTALKPNTSYTVTYDVRLANQPVEHKTITFRTKIQE